MVQEATASETKEELAASESSPTGVLDVTDESRDEAALKLVDRYALWSGAAGLIPLPFIDVAAVGGVQLQMLRRLSQIYGVPFSENRGKSLIASLAGAMLPATTAFGVVSTLKSVPAIGTTIGVLTMPAFSAGATYIIGKVFIQHFASGGTLLDFNPPDYREFIKAQKDKLKTKAAETVSPVAEAPRTPRNAVRRTSSE
jgi:uncharacterized protein (DUF697 family)